MSTNEPTKKRHAATHIGGVLGALAGLYFGFNMIIPALSFGLFMILYKKTEDDRNTSESLRTARSILSAHTTWMLIGAILIPNGFAVVGIDILLMLFGIVYLLTKPQSKALAAVAIIYQVASIGSNIMAMGTPSNPQFRALILHAVLRACFIGFLVRSMMKTKRSTEEFKGNQAA